MKPFSGISHFQPPTGWRAASWPKLVRETAGLRVATLSPIENGLSVIPAGAIMTITGATAWSRITLRGEPCAHCGVVMLCSRVLAYDLQPIEQEH